MLLWIAFALLTAAVLAAMLAPLGRPAPAGAAEAEEDAGAHAVYRDQLAEIEAERAAGFIGATEAEAARIEVSRRLIASAPGAAPAASVSPAVPVPTSGRVARHDSLLLATAVAVPLLTIGLYLAHGSPGLTSNTHTEAAQELAKVARMIAKVEERLKVAPDDGMGWEVIAPVYLKLGRFAEAATAYAHAVRLQGESVKLLTGLAEASMMAKDGLVTEEARAAYERILKIEPGRVEPRFWLALGKEQDGRLADALVGFTALLKEAAPGATYRPALEKRIAEVSARMKSTAQDTPTSKDKSPSSTAKSPSGPTADDVEAAAKLGTEERAAMVKGMVEGLAERLKRDGRDLPGWKRLIQSYQVLDRRSDARAALAEARRQFEGNADALADLTRLAAQLGLGS